MTTGDDGGDRPRATRRDPRAEPSDPPKALRPDRPDLAPQLDERAPPSSGARSAPRDPRVDPDSEPPPSKARSAPPRLASEPPLEAASDWNPSEPPAAKPSSEAPPKAKSEAPSKAKSEAPPKSASAAPASRAVVSIRDPRLEEVEPMLASSSWDAICKKLGPPDRAGQLPPTLGLIYALARREVAGEASAGDANQIAIRCVAAMFDVAPESATAMVVAKRLLRRNPGAWRSASAPSKNVSILIMLIAIVIGAAVGWYFSRGGKLPFKL